MKALLIALALLAPSAHAVEIGLHLGSQHIPAREWLNNSNPGIYARQGNWQAGYYRNSYQRDTFYGAFVQPIGPIDLMVGLGTGYKRECKQTTELPAKPAKTKTSTKPEPEYYVECRGFSRHTLAPLGAITYLIPAEVLGIKPRLWLMPGIKASTVIHLSVERSF